MALDEAISISVRTGSSPPTLRLYGWAAPSVSIGVFQSLDDIHHDYCAAQEIAIVRRPTGGRAILHGDEVTYSFSARNTGMFSRGLYPAFYALGRAFKIAFGLLGLDAEMKKHPARGASLSGSARCFASVSYGELTLQGQKIIGSAQKRWTDGFLQQGSIPLSLDHDLEARVFRHHSAAGGRSGLRQYLPDIAAAQIEAAIVAGVEKEFPVQLIEEQPSPEEQALADRLAAEKYRTAVQAKHRERKPLSYNSNEKAPQS